MIVPHYRNTYLEIQKVTLDMFQTELLSSLLLLVCVSLRRLSSVSSSITSSGGGVPGQKMFLWYFSAGALYKQPKMKTVSAAARS